MRTGRLERYVISSTFPGDHNQSTAKLDARHHQMWCGAFISINKGLVLTDLIQVPVPHAKQAPSFHGVYGARKAQPTDSRHGLSRKNVSRME